MKKIVIAVVILVLTAASSCAGGVKDLSEVMTDDSSSLAKDKIYAAHDRDKVVGIYEKTFYASFTADPTLAKVAKVLGIEVIEDLAKCSAERVMEIVEESTVKEILQFEKNPNHDAILANTVIEDCAYVMSEAAMAYKKK